MFAFLDCVPYNEDFVTALFTNMQILKFKAN